MKKLKFHGLRGSSCSSSFWGSVKTSGGDGSRPINSFAHKPQIQLYKTANKQISHNVNCSKSSLILKKSEAVSPESEVFHDRSAGQEDIESCDVRSLQGLGRGLDHHGPSKPQSIKGGVPWWTSEQTDASYPPHRRPWSPRVSSSSHSDPLQAVLWGTLACLIPPALEVDLHNVPLKTLNSFRSSCFPAGAPWSACWAEPDRFWLQLCHTEPTWRYQACPTNFPRLPEGVGRHTLSSIFCPGSSTFPLINFSSFHPFLPYSDITFCRHVKQNLDNRRWGTNLADQNDWQDPGPTQELVWGNRGIYSQGAVWSVDSWLEETSTWTSDEKCLSLCLQAGVPWWLWTVLPQKHVFHIENLKVHGGINWRWSGRRPDVSRNLLAFSNWEGRIYKVRLVQKSPSLLQLNISGFNSCYKISLLL